MGNNIDNNERYSPEKLLRGFSKTNFIAFAIIAILLHGLVIGATSVNYIYYTLNPEAAKALEEKKAAAKKVPEKKTAVAEPVPGKETNQSAAVSQQTSIISTASSSAAAGKDKTDSGVPIERKDAPVIKEITATAKSNEIPKTPDDLGIKIEDTNPK